MTTTPRTDAEVFFAESGACTVEAVVPTKLARQLETELAQAKASVENYASAAEELRREVNELRAELARIQGQTRWQCTCGGTNCEGQRENEEQARLLDMSATREARLLADIAKRDALIQRILDYPYLPQNLATIIRKELENEQR